MLNWHQPSWETLSVAEFQQSWYNCLQVAVSISAWHSCNLNVWLYSPVDGICDFILAMYSWSGFVAWTVPVHGRYLLTTPCLKVFPTFIFSVNDDDELVGRASTLLVRMCGVTPPLPLVNPLLDAIFEAIQNSPVCVSLFRVLMFHLPDCLCSPGEFGWKLFPLFKVSTICTQVTQYRTPQFPSVFYFRQVPLISEIKIVEMLEVSTPRCHPPNYL